MNHKLFEIVLTYLFVAMLTGGCAAVNVPSAAPLVDGDAVNLFQGTTRWLSTSGDVMIRTFYNPVTGITVHARPLADGWAMACEKSQVCDDLVGYLVNTRTYNMFRDWMLGAGGFVEIIRNVPPLPTVSMPTIAVIPAFMAAPSFSLDMMMCSSGMAAVNDSGDCVGVNPVFTRDESDGFADETGEWSLVELP